MLPEFKAYSSIPRLFRGCTVTEKLDGTNAIVHISDDGVTVTAGSRNRWLSLEHDNYGFGRWVSEHEAELKSLGPGYHYGEWWGCGIQRRYGLSEKRFSLFNVGRWGTGGPDADKLPACCGVVPVLYEGEFSQGHIMECLAGLKATGSVAAPGFMDPEGIVVLVNRNLFKVTLGGDGHKGVAA